MIVAANKELAFDYLQKELNLRWSDDFRGALFVPEKHSAEVASKEHVGVAVGWSNFIGKTCTVSIAIPKPECLTRAVIREIFRFPFEVCGCNAVLALVDSENRASAELCRRSGFKPVHRVLGGGVDGDLIIFQMDRATCRWLKRVH